MRPLIDCPSCACLLDTRESACPFCGAVVHRTEGWSILGLGFMIGLATAACGDKSGPSTATEGSSSSSGESSGTVGTSGTDSTTGTTDGETTISESSVPTTFGEVSAYAGPDTNETFPPDSETAGNTDTGTDTGTSTSTSTSTTGTGTESGSSSDFPDTSAYAGPDTSDT